jgi:hypothetical protein
MTKRWGNFLVYYPRGREKLVEKTLKDVTAKVQEIRTILGVEPTYSRIVFAPDNDTFYSLTGRGFPEWGIGAALYEKNMIVLKSIEESGGNLRQIQNTLVHELVHIFLWRTAQNFQLPRWFNEGLAMYFTDEPGFSAKAQFSRYVLTGNVMPLSQIDDVLRFYPEKARQAYTQSSVAIECLVNVFQWSSVKSLVKLLEEENSFSDAFQLGVGVSVEEFEGIFRQWLKKRYGWYFLLDINTILFGILPFLFFVVLFVVIRRNRKKLRQWEKEENFLDSQNLEGKI